MMRAQQASWFILLSTASIFTILAPYPAWADDQTIVREPLPSLASPSKTAAAPAPETTGSLPKSGSTAPDADLMPRVPSPAASRPVTPDQPSNLAVVPPPSVPATPAAASAKPPIVGTQSTPAASPPAPTFADRIHQALDAYLASPLKGRETAEMRKERSAIADFYAGRSYAPLWVEDGKPTTAARAAMAQIARAGDDGLSISALPAPNFGQANTKIKDAAPNTSDEALAAAEVALSAEVVAYGRQASGSRVDPARISRLIGARPDLADPSKILSSVAAAAASAGTVLEDFNPPQPGYRALREKLAELRRETGPEAANQPIPRGPALKVGMSDPRVPLIRTRFGLDANASATKTNLLYDTRVAAAVAEFQKAYGLPASGVLTSRTVAALSDGEPSRLENELLANMEFWRWMPRDLGKNRIEVNIPDFTVRVYRNDELVWRNKVIVGKPKTPTPVFSDVVRYVIVNPYWNVPPSIIRKEMLPKVGGDPASLARYGFQVFTRHGRLVVRQPPGAHNALGRIKFMFPNKYSVYLHDTPSRGLFASQRRAYSHGCVRVDQPFGLAEAVLGQAHGWTEAKVERLIGDRQRYIYLPEPLPIHIEYFTAFVDGDGRLQLRDDIYRYTRAVEVALGLDEEASLKRSEAARR